MKVKRYATALVLASGLALALAWLLTGAPIPNAQAAPQNPTADVIYVDADAAGPADGLTWSTAFTNVQDALSSAGPGDEIWVAEGVYTPDYDPNSGTYTGYMTATFVLTDDVALYGGFVATETLRTQRNWEAHVTILSGDLDGNDVTDAHGVVTSTANIIGANAWTVLTSNGLPETTVLDGFVVTAGNALGSDCLEHAPCQSGGGMYNFDSNLMLTNVTFSGNTAAYFGGGMYNSGSSPTLTNVTFNNNSASGAHSNGGGMYNSGSNPTLINVTFNNNSANGTYGNGGGMYNSDSNPILTDVTLSGNSASYRGGGMYNTNNSNPTLINVTFSGNSASRGGGMYNHWHNGPTLTDTTFSDNTADDRGGGMYNYGSSPVFSNVTFSGNAATYGGGIYNFRDSNPTLVNVTFTGNTADNNGGAIHNEDSSPILTNIFFGGNSAAGGGGGIYNDYYSRSTLANVTFSGNSARIGGGIRNHYNSDVKLVNATFSGNSAGTQGGGISNGYRSSLTLVNSILWGNTAAESGDQICSRSYSSVLVVSHTLIQDSGGSGAGWDADLGTDGGGNIDAHPRFVRAPNPGDGDWTTLADNDYGNLRLQPNSPAIDAGDNTALPADIADLDDDGNTSEPLPLDLNGQARRFDSPTADTGKGTAPIVDMGAYEQPSRLYVDADATDPADGLTWSTAFRNLQPALNKAKPGYEIWVAEGVYVPTAGITRTATFQLKDGVAVYGGFVGGESKRKARDPHANLTILSGDLDGNDVTDSHGIVTNAANIVGGNAYHVVTGNGLTEATILDGFVITGGKADGSDSHNFGGGMVNNSSNPTLANIIFSGNAAGYGGGMHNSGSSPQLVNVSFSGNAATYGGGMYNSDSSPRLTNAVFSGNSATVYGGGMRNEDSNPVLINTTLSGNAAASGGGIYNASGHMTVYNTILWGNTASISGTQIHNASSAVTITHSLVQDSGGSGAGWDTALGTDGGGNIDADPQFARDPDLGDDDYGDLRLLSSSPAIDKGDNTALPADIADLDNDGNTGEPVPLDRAGKPRIVDIVDMGAYEWYLQVFVPVVLKN